jgi:hypothetical protein
MIKNGQERRIAIRNLKLLWLPGVAALMILGASTVAPAEVNRHAPEISTWPYAKETQAQRDARMAWWREARFGMFIHWGVYSVPAGIYDGKRVGGNGEWIMFRESIPVARYKQYAKQFNPVKYDPDAWVRLAKEAGMKYIVITAKHHDGFALFDSKVTDWDVVDATPYGKDLLKPLAQACRKHGLKLGFYYSQAQDWCHVGGAKAYHSWDDTVEGDMDDYVRAIAMPQVAEILTKYGDIAFLWWDTPEGMIKERADMVQPLLRLQPGIITNDRLGGHYWGDLRTPEQHIPATGLDYDWETCMTMNDTWGFKSWDDNWKSTTTLLRNLVDIASKGGNYLLNVGPTSEGEIPAASIQRLQAIGKWMKVNAESIYGTSASPFSKQLTWGRCTRKTRAGGTRLYLHVFDWPADGQVVLPGIKNELAKAFILETKKELRTEAGPCVPVDADLSWTPGVNVTRQSVYFGTDPAALSQVDSGDGILATAANATLGGPLQPDTTYFWRVDGNNNNESRSFPGTTWSFKTPRKAGTPTAGGSAHPRTSSVMTAGKAGNPAIRKLEISTAQYFPAQGSEDRDRGEDVTALLLDDNLSTVAHTTSSFTTNAHGQQCLGFTLSIPTQVGRLRINKFPVGGGLDIWVYYTTDTDLDLGRRTWQPVTGLTNGYEGTELITLRSPEASVSGNKIEGELHDGWFSVTFDSVYATGIAVGVLSNPNIGNEYLHLGLREAELYGVRRRAAAPGPADRMGEAGMIVHVPDKAIDEIVSVLVLDIKGELQVAEGFD